MSDSKRPTWIDEDHNEVSYYDYDVPVEDIIQKEMERRLGGSLYGWLEDMIEED